MGNPCRMEIVQLTYRKCKLCGKRVNKQEALYFHLRAFCCYEHLKEYIFTPEGKRYINRQHKVQQAKDRKKLKSKGDHIKEAQAIVNRYARLRDIYNNRDCISCKKAYDGDPYKWDAGHLISRRHPKTRFNLWNINLQCVKCNRYGYGELLEYRSNLIARIGKEKVDWIQDNFREEHKLTIEYLERLKKVFRKKVRMIEKRMQERIDKQIGRQNGDHNT